MVSHATALSFLQSMLMGYSFGDIERYRFCGSGGSMSKFEIEPGGRGVCRYMNHGIF